MNLRRLRSAPFWGKYPPAEPEALLVAGPSKGPDRAPKSKPLAPRRHPELCVYKTIGRPARNCTHKRCGGALPEPSNFGGLPARAAESPFCPGTAPGTGLHPSYLLRRRAGSGAGRICEECDVSAKSMGNAYPHASEAATIPNQSASRPQKGVWCCKTSCQR
jgi:hypothetical protein